MIIGSTWRCDDVAEAVFVINIPEVERDVEAVGLGKDGFEAVEVDVDPW